MQIYFLIGGKGGVNLDMNLDEELVKYKGFTEKYTQKISANLSNKIDEEIRKRISALGVNVNDKAFIMANFEFIEREGDEFKHLFYKPESRSIFSIQKNPTVIMGYEEDGFVKNEITCIATYKYY